MNNDAILKPITSMIVLHTHRYTFMVTLPLIKIGVFLYKLNFTRSTIKIKI